MSGVGALRAGVSALLENLRPDGSGGCRGACLRPGNLLGYLCLDSCCKVAAGAQTEARAARLPGSLVRTYTKYDANTYGSVQIKCCYTDRPEPHRGLQMCMKKGVSAHNQTRNSSCNGLRPPQQDLGCTAIDCHITTAGAHMHILMRAQLLEPRGQLTHEPSGSRLGHPLVPVDICRKVAPTTVLHNEIQLVASLQPVLMVASGQQGPNRR